MVYQSPWIYEMDLNGHFKDSFLIPANLQVYKGDSGARENDVLEGISFPPDYRYLWASMEGPVYEDGPRADFGYAHAPVRFTRFDVKTKKMTGQYAYQLDAVAYAPVPATAFRVNGISESLHIGDDRFLVVERSYSKGVAHDVVKIYLADFKEATEISTVKSLQENRAYQPARKTLLFNLEGLGFGVDNVEGITIGPRLPNGHYSLLLIVDNNFSAVEEQQLFLFEILP